MNAITTQQMADFVSNNINVIDSYDIQPLYKKTYSNVLRKLTGLYFNDGGNWEFELKLLKFKIDFNDTISETLDKFLGMIKKFGFDGIEGAFITYYKLDSLFSYYGFHKQKEEKPGDYMQYNDRGTTEIIYFFRYVVYNKLDDDYAETHKLMKDLGISYNSDSYEVTIENVTVKRFKNGRIDVKGLTDEQQKRIDDVFESKEKLSLHPKLVLDN